MLIACGQPMDASETPASDDSNGKSDTQLSGKDAVAILPAGTYEVTFGDGSDHSYDMKWKSISLKTDGSFFASQGAATQYGNPTIWDNGTFFISKGSSMNTIHFLYENGGERVFNLYPKSPPEIFTFEARKDYKDNNPKYVLGETFTASHNGNGICFNLYDCQLQNYQDAPCEEHLCKSP
jgi:hypothetical protein